MSQYYLIAQLPSLDGLAENAPLPITEEQFLTLCGRLLGKKTVSELERLTLLPSIGAEHSESPLIEGWNDNERKLRVALAKARADKMGKPFDLPSDNLSTAHMKIASEAVEIENPLEAESFLLHYRLRALEMYRPMDVFSKEYLFYYGLKLKLILRIRGFDTKAGEAAYKDIYRSILDGDRTEVSNG